jgi:hypothetical protein
MRHRLISLAATVALCLSGGGAAGRLSLVEAGIVCPEVREAVSSRPAPDTEAGRIDTIEGEISFDLSDRTVPLIRHVSFGFRIALDEAGDDADVTIVVEHPPFGERSVSRESWVQPMAAGATAVNLFTFDFPYEMVPGPWTFAAEIDGERLVEVPFDVGTPGASERLDAVCLSMLSV